jgi:hypothetical protein
MDTLLTFPWWGAAFFTSLGGAAYFLVNQQGKVSPAHLMVWRGLGVALLYAPFAFLMPLPTDPLFYIVSVISGLCISVYDYKLFSGARHYGAGSLSRLQPLGILLTFLLWFIISTPYRVYFLGLELYKIFGVVACLLIGMVALMSVRRNPISREVLLFMLPMVCVLAVIDVCNKIAIGIAPPPEGLLLYPILNSFVAGVISLWRCYREDNNFHLATLWQQPLLKVAGIFLLVYIWNSTNKTYAMAKAESPSYVVAVASLSTVWIYLFNRWRGVLDAANWRAEFVVVMAMVGLILLTA